MVRQIKSDVSESCSVLECRQKLNRTITLAEITLLVYMWHHARSIYMSYVFCRLMSGGADSGFNKVKPEEYTPRLFHFSGTGKNVVVTQVNQHNNINILFTMLIWISIWKFYVDRLFELRICSINNCYYNYSTCDRLNIGSLSDYNTINLNDFRFL